MLLLQAGSTAPPSSKDQAVTAVLNALADGTISVEQYHAAIAYASLPSSPSSSDGITTLVVCPVSVLGNWEKQIIAHVAPNTLRVALYHGSDRKEMLAGLGEIDVLICSYNTLSYDYGEDENKSKTSEEDFGPPAPKKFKRNSIFQQKFHRIILDEAHVIRNSKSRMFKACKAVKANAKHGLCLTGTPIQVRFVSFRFDAADFCPVGMRVFSFPQQH